jgi:hypothetical protein
MELVYLRLEQSEACGLQIQTITHVANSGCDSCVLVELLDTADIELDTDRVNF